MGNCGCGSAVIHSRKSSCRFSAFNKYVSISAMYAKPRCVFCSKTHCPVCVAVDMSLRAMISWPCPIDTPSVAIFLRLASSSMSFVGSAPGDRRQMSGTYGVDSAHVVSMFRGTDSTKRSPIAFAMYVCAATMVRSSRSALTMHIRSKASTRSSKSGTRASSGASLSYHWRQSLSLTFRDSTMSENELCCESATMSSQHLSGIQSFGFFFTDLMSSEPPPFKKRFTRSRDNALAETWILFVNISANVSLCRSNKPR